MISNRRQRSRVCPEAEAVLPLVEAPVAETEKKLEKDESAPAEKPKAEAAEKAPPPA